MSGSTAATTEDWFREEAGRDDRYNYLYAKDELEEWVERIKELGRKSDKVFVITNNHYRGQALANALQIKNMITGEKLDIPELILEKIPRPARDRPGHQGRPERPLRPATERTERPAGRDRP